MSLLMGDPNMQMRIYGVDFNQDSYDFVAPYEEDNPYDDFIGKLIRKRRTRRSRKPRVITRRKKRDEKRIIRGKRPRFPELIRVKPTGTLIRKATKDPKAPKGSTKNPITNKDLKGHKVMNVAIQNELKTLQEEQKVEGLKKKVEQEDLKKENLKQQAGLMGAGKGIIVVAGVLGTIGLLAYLNKSKSTKGV